MASEQSQTITIDRQRYYIQSLRTSIPVSKLRNFLTVDASPFLPVTALLWEEAIFHCKDLKRACQAYGIIDDVWCPTFLSLTLLLCPTNGKCDIRAARTICINDQKHKLPIGPLVIEKCTGQVFRVAKLVKDTNAAFITAIAPKLNGTPRSVYRELPQQGVLEIALPSRLYCKATKDKPLAGLRVGLKDVFALRGTKTGFGSIAWRATYEPEDFTAPCVQLLIDAGAIIIGKVVTSELAEGVEAGEWTQGVCPYNPRGDGHQKSSSSSTGSAVAAAAYDWLDVTIGTDCGGSIRHPAGVNGLFGQRPSIETVNLTGVLAATDLFNTVGIFARSVELFTTVGSYLVNPTRQVPRSIEPKRRGYNLLYPTRSMESNDPYYAGQSRWFPHPEADPSIWTEGEKLVEAVVTRMETELDCKRIPFNIYDIWAATPPKGQSRSLDQATGHIYGDITTSSACATAVDQFIADYAAANNGQQPSMSKVVERRLEYGRELPDARIAAALEATAAFKQWMTTTLFGSYDQDLTTLVVFPQTCGQPDYRDDATRWNGKLFIEAFSIYALGYLCGCPDYTIPIGELPYESRMTKDTEYLPVSMSLVGKPGTDQELFDVVQLLHRAGVVSDVMAGKRLYKNV